jgi:MFS family permease
VAVIPSRAIAPAAVDFADHTRRHIAVRLIPFLFILYISNYLDRTSVAYAALGMSHDLGFSDRVLGLGFGVFFISYVAMQIPGALLVERWSARRMISISMIAWGSITGLTGLVHTPSQLYFARFILGAAEGGFFPGVIVYLSHWFIQEDRAKATSNFMGAIPLSFVIGSPIAGWILGVSWLGVGGWRWLFILEGMPAIVLGIMASFFLTDFPVEAAWLAPSQRQWIDQKLAEERSVSTRTTTVGQTLKSPTVLLLAALTFCIYFSLYSFVFSLPTILKSQAGISNVGAGLWGAVPYAAAFVAMQVNGWHSDKDRERRWHSAVPMFIGAVGLLSVIAPIRSTPLLVLGFTITGLLIAYLPAFWAIPTEILSRSAAAAAVGLINAVGSVAGFAGPYAFGYLHTRTGSFSWGLGLMLATALAGGILVLRTPDARRAAMGNP